MFRHKKELLVLLLRSCEIYNLGRIGIFMMKRL